MYKLFEAFSGYGSQRMAFNNINAKVETIGISEIDKVAIKAYTSVHGDTTNFGDISKIEPNTLPNFDIFTYSFPCQDISQAGYKLGFSNSSTRSGLLWYCDDVIKIKKPKFLLLENVKNIQSKQFKPDLDKWINILTEYGYTSYSMLLNAKDFGAPQNRNRYFLVSILNGGIRWSEKPKYAQKYILDILDSSISENLVLHNVIPELDLDNLKFVNDSKRIGYLSTTAAKLPQSRRVYSDHGISPTLDTSYSLKIYDSRHKVFRKTTGDEYLKLMGIKDLSPFSILSNAQKAKLAGNSIVVPVLEYIFSNMLYNSYQ